jgi:polysaccharide biosynthesis/export protein
MRNIVLSLMLICGLLQGCATRQQVVGEIIPLVHESQIVRPGGYRLNTGDRLRVVVFGQDALSNAYQLDSIGNISMPLIGSVMLAGSTPKEAEILIANKLKDGYVRQPFVAVEIETYRPFFILGEVTASGQFPFVNGMTAQTAIAIAAGYTPRAKRDRVEITRTINGIAMRAEVPMTHHIMPGDVITVPERWF